MKNIHENIKSVSLSLLRWSNSITDAFFNWDSLHERLNNHCKAWSYKKKKHSKIKTYSKSF